LVNSNWSCELRLASKNQYILDWSQNFTIQTSRENANFPKSLIEFGPWMQNLQHFELELKLCEDTFVLFVTLGLKAVGPFRWVSHGQKYFSLSFHFTSRKIDVESNTSGFIFSWRIFLITYEFPMNSKIGTYSWS